ncbi:hypothetical protein cypCar_00006474 [Cyprinus carpio]|nr:hypothetical protein cypCar_00006474 [Cyprinus carpio]
MPEDGSWAAEYCSKVTPNHSHGAPKDNCDYSNWKAEHFINTTALEICSSKAGLKDYICKNATLYLTLVRKQPLLLDYCLNSEEKQGTKCILQKLFDMLPAPYDFETSQLCVNPLPILQEAIHKLTLCEGVVDERTGWLATVSYVLRVLDFVVGLSAGLEEGQREVRQSLGQAILLSSLQDNASFWATLQPEASITYICQCLILTFILSKEYLQMPRESIRSVVMSAEKDAVKRFLSHVHQSWDQLQVETIQVSPKEQEAMETMTAAFIHKFPRVTPELFIDLSQFIPYMSVSDIMTFPASLMVNESVLLAISDHSSEMKSPQKQAFIKRLLQSSVAGDVPSWPPHFLSAILPLLPHLPVSQFQQLTSQQVSSNAVQNDSADRKHHKRVNTRKCVVVELRKWPDIDLNDLDPSFAARLPLTMLEHLSNSSLISVLDYVRQHFIDFLQLPRHKQTALAEKAIDVLGISENGLTGASMDMLGPFLPFQDRDVLAHIDREALKLRLEELKQYCLLSDTFRQIAALLTERSMLGDPKTWTAGDVEHVGRLLFTLSPQQIRSLPLGDLGKDTVEQVLMSQWLWKSSELGKACLDLKGLREKMNDLTHRIVKGRWWMRRGPIPSCADIKGTFPSAWRSYQLNLMKKKELKMCVEFIGQDDTLDAEQREALWMELRPVYKPVKQLEPEQVLELGCIVTEMGERELQAVNLSNLAVVAHLGGLSGWNSKKMRAVVLGIMKQLKQKPEELGVVELVSFGLLLCGFSSSEISRLDPFNLSGAALFLGEMILPCSEQQTEALTSRLSSPLGFGPVSSWGSEVFTEIGTLAAGLEDMVLSALIKEQVEGLTPAAITLIPPRKFAVVFSATQLYWLSSEQAFAVTEEQWAELDNEQRQALGMAQYEGELMLEHRGRNQAPSLWFAGSFRKCLLLFVCTLWILL